MTSASLLVFGRTTEGRRSLHRISPRRKTFEVQPRSFLAGTDPHPGVSPSLSGTERRFRGPEAGPPLSRPHTHRLFHMTDFQGARR